MFGTLPKSNQKICFSALKEILCSAVAALLGTPGGILLFIPIYHPLHDIYKLHSEVTFFILFVIALLIVWSADRSSKNPDTKFKIHWSTFVLVGHLVLHYLSFFIIPIFFKPEHEISMGVREVIGPCNEYVPIHTAFGMVSILHSVIDSYQPLSWL